MEPQRLLRSLIEHASDGESLRLLKLLQGRDGLWPGNTVRRAGIEASVVEPLLHLTDLVPQYLEMLEHQPRDVKLSSWVRNMGRQQYRNTIVNMAERRYVRAAGSGLMAMVLDPAHACYRLRKRVLPP